MWKIKYFNNEPKEYDEDKNPIENIVPLEYPVYTEEDKIKWFDIIEKTYGKYGEVTVEECADDREPTLEQLLEQKIAKLEANTLDLTEAFVNKQFEQDTATLGI